MSMEFGWWNKNPERGKFQVHAVIHGGKISWVSKQGHFTSWRAYIPDPADWDRLILEADNRRVRRLLSPKQFEAIRLLRPSPGA